METIRTEYLTILPDEGKVLLLDGCPIYGPIYAPLDFDMSRVTEVSEEEIINKEMEEIDNGETRN